MSADLGVTVAGLPFAIDLARGIRRGEQTGEARGIGIGLARARAALESLAGDAPEPARAPVAPDPDGAHQPAPARVDASRRPAPLNASAPPAGLSRATAAIVATLEAAWPRALPFLTAAKHAGVGLRSSRFRTYEPELRASGRVEEVDGKYRARVEAPSGVSLIDAAAARMQPAQARVLRALEGIPYALTREEIAAAAGVSPTSSTTGAALVLLAGLDMAVRQPDGRYRLADTFRPHQEPTHGL